MLHYELKPVWFPTVLEIVLISIVCMFHNVTTGNRYDVPVPVPSSSMCWNNLKCLYIFSTLIFVIIECVESSVDLMNRLHLCDQWKIV